MTIKIPILMETITITSLDALAAGMCRGSSINCQDIVCDECAFQGGEALQQAISKGFDPSLHVTLEEIKGEKD